MEFLALLLSLYGAEAKFQNRSLVLSLAEAALWFTAREGNEITLEPDRIMIITDEDFCQVWLVDNSSVAWLPEEMLN